MSEKNQANKVDPDDLAHFTSQMAGLSIDELMTHRDLVSDVPEYVGAINEMIASKKEAMRVNNG